MFLSAFCTSYCPTSSGALSTCRCHSPRSSKNLVACLYSVWLCSWTPHYQRLISAVAPLQSRHVSKAAHPPDPVSKNVASWSDHRKKAKRLHPDAEKDIVADDLWATLEAHRATNRTSVIRSIRTKNPTIFHPELKPVARLSEAEETNEDPAKKWGLGRFWPADSIQNERLPLEKQNKTRRGGLLEYEGQCLKPHWPWYDERPPIYREQPWLSHLKEPDAYGDGISRSGFLLLNIVLGYPLIIKQAGR